MILVKTLAGQQAFRERSNVLSLRQRAAFILCDGKRRIQEVLAATTSVGVTLDDLQTIVAQGLLTQMSENAQQGQSRGSRTAEQQQRYLAAYPIAVALTANLGLRGFRLNLALETAQNCDDLVALWPQISAAVGAGKCGALRQALFPRSSAE